MNDKKNNSTTKYLVGGVIVLMILLVGGFALLGNNPEKNSATSSSTEKIVENPIDSVEVPAVPETDKPDGEVPFGGSIYSDAGVPDIEEEEGFGGSDEEIKIDNEKLLVPIDEMGKWGLYSSKKVDGPEKYYRITSFIPEKELVFEIGYIEGCEEGCQTGNCPAECNLLENWRVTKEYIPTQKEGVEGNFFEKVYNGVFAKTNDSNYKTNSFRCEVDAKTMLIRCASYWIIEDPEGKVFEFITNETGLTIVLQ